MELSTDSILDGLTEAERSYPIYINGKPTGLSTPTQITGMPAGDHIVELRPGNASAGIGTRLVTVSTGGTQNIFFSLEDMEGTPATLTIDTVDIFAARISGFDVYVNGVQYPAQTPAVITNLLQGTHYISLRKDGWKPSQTIPVELVSGLTFNHKIVVYPADYDYDGIGDPLELGTNNVNIWAQSDLTDSDDDGLLNVDENALLSRYGIYMNIYDDDTDGDAMTDSDEVNYDGITNTLGLSAISSNIAVRTAMVPARFKGSYLDGISAMPTGVNCGITIEGDAFLSPNAHFA